MSTKELNSKVDISLITYGKSGDKCKLVYGDVGEIHRIYGGWMLNDVKTLRFNGVTEYRLPELLETLGDIKRIQPKDLDALLKEHALSPKERRAQLKNKFEDVLDELGDYTKETEDDTLLEESLLELTNLGAELKLEKSL